MSFLLPKPERVLVPSYRAWLALQPCCACRRSGVEAVGHHVETGGMGTKGNDLLEIPLCQECHRRLHDLGAETFVTEVLGIGFTWYYEQTAKHLAKWVQEHVLEHNGSVYHRPTSGPLDKRDATV